MFYGVYKVRNVMILVGMLLLGLCVGGIVSAYALTWAIYGMGHSLHACNVVGQAILLICPVLAFAVLVLSAMHLNGFLVGEGETKGPVAARVESIAKRVSKKRAAMALLFSIGFLLGPILAFQTGQLLYSLGQNYGVWISLPLQGWG